MKLTPKLDFNVTIGALALVSAGLIFCKINGILLPKWLVITFYSACAVNLVYICIKAKGSKSCKSSYPTQETGTKEPPSS